MTNEKSKVSLEDIYQLIKEVKEDLTSRIDNINKEVKNLTNKVDQEVKAVKVRIDKIEGENAQLKKKLEIAERKLKKSNLIFYGVEGSSKETQNNLINEIKKIINERMEISLDITDISNCYRIGRGNSVSKPILITFVSQIKRGEVLNNGKKLKGTNIYVREDLIEKDLQEQKILVQHLKAARNNNQRAIIKGNKLYVDDQVYSAQDLQRSSHASPTPGYYSPPPVRLTNSEPSTPTPFEKEEEEEANREKIASNKKDPELQTSQENNDKTKRKITRKPSVEQTPKRSQPTRSTTLQRK